MTELAVPELSLVVLVGVSGSGKSTFASRHFKPGEVLSSDAFRAMVGDDENDMSATEDAFDALHYVAAKRLRAGRLAVVDATNVQQHARASLVRIAREHDVLPVAIVLDLPVEVCLERHADRTDRNFSPRVIHRHRADLRRSLKHLAKEGFRQVHVLRSVEEVDAATVTRQRLYNDKRELTGPFDLIGDVHGCLTELVALLGQLGWQVERDDAGRPVNATNPQGRTAVFLGDLVDRGPDSAGVLRLAMGMVAAGTALCVPGNHEFKLLRKLRGRNVKVAHGLAETLEQLAAEPPEFTTQVADFIDGLVSHYRLDGGKLVVAHAGLKEEYQGRASGRVRSFAMYGETTGETDEYGLPVRYPWAREYRGSAMVVYGHTPVPVPEWINNTICLDTGCVFGGRLTALRYPERQLVSVPAEREYYEPARPLGMPADEGSGQGREADGLSVADVTGRRHVDTAFAVEAAERVHCGTVTVTAEQAAAALEVMSRFAVDPRWLRWLPPTMAPCATSTVDGYLEHPAEAFADYRRLHLPRVMCQEKHMGSRAVVLVCRDPDVAVDRFGFDKADTANTATAGAVYTRTGRSFFTEPQTSRGFYRKEQQTAGLLERVRGAVTAAGLWEELDTDWLLLDTELMPWSAKAMGLLRDQYGAVAAAARTALPAARAVLDAVAARGITDPDSGAAMLAALRERTAARADNAERFAAAYRRYCWPTEGLAGIRLAPFAVLAGAGASYAGRDPEWHLNLVDRLVAADTELFATTRRVVVDLADPASEQEATQWWLGLTGAGGEGMVVKPYQLTLPRGGLVQPGVKCRGREYLRIIYGPDYTEPSQLERLRDRRLSRKQRLALREHALGLTALDRAAAGEPLWRIHEVVAGVLALESEPVDPRL